MSKAQLIVDEFEEAEFQIKSLKKKINQEEQAILICNQQIKEVQKVLRNTSKNISTHLKQLTDNSNTCIKLKKIYPKAKRIHAQEIKIRKELDKLLKQ